MELNFSLKIGGSQKNKRSLENDNKPIEITEPGGVVREQPVEVKTPEQAMRLSTAFRCTDILSGSIASIPLLIKRKDDGYYSVDEDHELYDLLLKQASRRMNSYDTWCNAVIQTLNQGNAYLYIKRMFGDVDEIILCSNNSVTYDKYANTYVITDPINRLFGTYRAEDIIHLKNKSLDGGYTGVSTITYASTVFSISASADNQNLKTFQNGTQIKGIMSGVRAESRGLEAVTGDQISTVSQRVNREFNSGVNIVGVSGDMKFEQLSITPVDAQLLETKQFSVFDICRFYGVHPDKVFAGQPTNYKASEMSQVIFLADTLDPILCRIEAELNSKLIPRSVSKIYKIEFDRKALYKTDITTKSTLMEKEISFGVSTPNEWRMSEDRAPIPGGDVAFMSCNTAPIDSKKLRGEESKKDEQPKQTHT